MDSEIPLYDRKKSTLEYENIFEQGFMKFIYGTSYGRALEKRVIAKPTFSMLYGYLQNKSKTKNKIGPFATAHNIDFSDHEKNENEYTSFNDFFTRKFRPGKRPIDQNNTNLVSPCDGRLLSFTINNDVVIPVKGKSFSIEELIGDKALATQFKNGHCLIFRLAPMDYHRFCYIDHAKQSKIHRVNGLLHSVSQLSLEKMIPVFTENYREYTLLSTDNFGPVLHMDVGALVVGKIIQHKRESTKVMRGEEKGYFEFGGATIILLFQQKVITINADINEYSEKGIETLVIMGEVIGSNITDPQ